MERITNHITTVHDSPVSGEWLAHAHKDHVHRYQALFCPANFNIKIGPGDEVIGTVTCTSVSLRVCIKFIRGLSPVKFAVWLNWC